MLAVILKTLSPVIISKIIMFNYTTSKKDLSMSSFGLVELPSFYHKIVTVIVFDFKVLIIHFNRPLLQHVCDQYDTCSSNSTGSREKLSCDFQARYFSVNVSPATSKVNLNLILTITIHII